MIAWLEENSGPGKRWYNTTHAIEWCVAQEMQRQAGTSEAGTKPSSSESTKRR